MFEINWIRKKVETAEYFFTRHGEQERHNDSLTINDIEEAIFNGMILEQYKNDIFEAKVVWLQALPMQESLSISGHDHRLVHLHQKLVSKKEC